MMRLFAFSPSFNPTSSSFSLSAQAANPELYSLAWPSTSLSDSDLRPARNARADDR